MEKAMKIFVCIEMYLDGDEFPVENFLGAFSTAEAAHIFLKENNISYVGSNRSEFDGGDRRLPNYHNYNKANRVAVICEEELK
jgi:hypothetical protein